MIKLVFFLALCALSFPLSADYCYFIPPSDWLIADPQSLSPRVKVGFLGKESKGFCPSLNLATEEVRVTLGDYLKAVKKIHESDRSNRWRDLGKIQTCAGEARLTEIDKVTKWGAIRLLQMILIRDKTAYILTAAALKEEFPKFYQVFQKAFQSLTITSDLKTCMGPSEREHFSERLETLKSTSLDFSSDAFQKTHWIPFQTFLMEEFADRGAHFQILIAQAAQQELVKKN